MLKLKQKTLLSTITASLAFSMFAGCASIATGASELGTSAEGLSYDRTVVIEPGKKWVNVNAGEVVKFVVQEPGSADKSFTWIFDAFGNRVGDLSKLAPSGVLDRTVKVYVAPNPFYSS